MPRRYQRSRRKGSANQIPKGTIYVSRPSRYGNPYPINDEVSREQSIARFEADLKGMTPEELESYLAPLRGKDLACWCPLHLPCHADVLLKWANRADSQTVGR